MEDLRALAGAAEPIPADLSRLRELEAGLEGLLRASAIHCRTIADQLALVEEHAHAPLPDEWPGSTRAVALAERLSAAAAGCAD